MKKLILLSLLCLPAGTYAWEYWTVTEGTKMVRDATPPTDITYPRPGQSLPLRQPGDTTLLTTPISAAQLQATLEKPHLVIVPSREALNSTNSRGSQQ